MKSVRLILLLLMLLFMGVQYNDPDGLFWIAIYGATAAVLAISVWRPQWLRHPFVKWSLLAVTVGFAAAVWSYWPSQPQFWRQEVWWEEETAREGMGMMIAFVFLLFALPVAFVRPLTKAADKGPAS